MAPEPDDSPEPVVGLAPGTPRLEGRGAELDERADGSFEVTFGDIVGRGDDAPAAALDCAERLGRYIQRLTSIWTDLPRVRLA